jgi:hypothetical protein
MNELTPDSAEICSLLEQASAGDHHVGRSGHAASSMSWRSVYPQKHAAESFLLLKASVSRIFRRPGAQTERTAHIPVHLI